MSLLHFHSKTLQGFLLIIKTCSLNLATKFLSITPCIKSSPAKTTPYIPSHHGMESIPPSYPPAKGTATPPCFSPTATLSSPQPATNSTPSSFSAKPSHSRQDIAPNPNKCQRCRMSKKGCDGKKPVCSRCSQRGTQCVYGAAIAKDGNSNVAMPKKVAGVKRGIGSMQGEFAGLMPVPEQGMVKVEALDTVAVDMDIYGNVKTKAVWKNDKATATTSKTRAKRSRIPHSHALNKRIEVEYVEYSPDKAQQFLTQETDVAMEEALLDAEDIQAQDTDRGNDTCFRIIEFGDMDLKHLSPNLQVEWQEIAAMVYNALYFGEELVEDVDGEKKAQLRQLVEDLIALQSQRKDAPELVVALGKLVATVRFFYDFYEHFGRCAARILVGDWLTVSPCAWRQSIAVSLGILDPFLRRPQRYAPLSHSNQLGWNSGMIWTKTVACSNTNIRINPNLGCIADISINHCPNAVGIHSEAYGSAWGL
ncbi:uncharacterized protein BDR25DRAFT_363846 [Lindgomyces ingoldianus]|uniref:Uncharacterized protein n=1 Tax=Lindgomyces ingoldianus TaxID=673940 RepID=A0ACB6Q6U1_9PLEO|nr:uncharacterized protein BDR25DRAFT_363846 [Lindgomyces ingoldianus]KAF2462598.1 hypothetical protein BDR25DRAFT_363846 [Lindgomyces ingoldianus]